MANINMAKVNTLFKKGYLLAGVVMVANIFVVNEIKATSETESDENRMEMLQNNKGETNTNIYEQPNFIPTEKIDTDKNNKKKSFGKIIRNLPNNQNIYTFFAGSFFSIANNYLKLWDYNPGIYFKLGCFGWRSKSLLNGIFQFDINLNLGRGAFWTILLWLNSSSVLNTDEASFTEGGIQSSTTPKEQNFHRFRIVARSIEGFISIPLAIHIQGFDISIAFDSILFGLVVNRLLLPSLSRPIVYEDYIYNKIDDVNSRPSFSGDYNEIIKGKEKPVKIYNN